MFTKLRDYMGDNSVQGDSGNEEKKLRELCPKLLQADERVVFAFLGRGGGGRDTTYLTDRRLLIRDVQGITGKKVKYRSTPYGIIKAWSVSTAGAGLDGDMELEIWATGMDKQEVDFSKDKVDLFVIQQFLNGKILPRDTVYTVAIPAGVFPGVMFQANLGGQVVNLQCPPYMQPGMLMQAQVAPQPGPTYSGGVKEHSHTQDKQGIVDWLGDNATQVIAKELEEQLKRSPRVLLPDETVEVAFRSGRDLTVLTSKRLLIVDARGMTGKKVVYWSMLWSCARAFEVETAGKHFDRDCQISIWTNIPEKRIIKQDLRKGKSDVMAVQRFFSDKILGMDWVPASAAVDYKQGHEDEGSDNFFSWAGDDNRQIDAVKANEKFHSKLNILQRSEFVEMAFKGRRDMILFTNKRLVVIDVKGWSGKKKQFTSVPWSSVMAFAVKSAGSWMDKDSEVMLWTDVMHEPPRPKQQDQPPPPPLPGMSYLEFDFQKDKVDLMAVHRYLSSRCLPDKGGFMVPQLMIPPQLMEARPSGSVSKFLEWLGNDARQGNAQEMEAQLRHCGMLLDDEHVGMTFKAGRDSMVLTSRRVFMIDVKGFTGKRIEYKSLPYSSVRGFSVESAGSFDRDSELKLYTRNFWTMKKVSQDFRKGKADIIAIQSFIAHYVLGDYDGRPTIPKGSDAPMDPQAVGSFLSWLGGEAHQIDAAMLNKKLHDDPPILQEDETVEMAFKCGRDMYVHTTKRVLFVDVQGFTGKRVEFQTVPLKYCTGFAVSTAGSLGALTGSAAELRLYTDVPSKQRLNQDLKKGGSDVFEIQEMLAKKLLI